MGKRIVVFCLCLLLAWGGTEPVQAAPTVETVRVELRFSQGRPALVLAERMSASLAVICEHLLKDRPLAVVAAQEAEFKRLIGDVAERVLTGYSVDRVTLTTGAETQVVVFVQPWGPAVERAEVRLVLSGVSADMLPMVKNDLGPIEAEVQALLLGLSQDAVDWSGGAVKAEIRRRVEERLPEFQTTVDVRSGIVPVVDIVLLPIGQTVQRVSYQMSSLSIPNVLMMDEKETLGRAAQSIRGLPVQYAVRHTGELTQWLEKKAADTGVAKNYRLTPAVAFSPAVDTLVQLRLESNRYRFWVEGNLDLDQKDDNVFGKAHAGKFFSPKDEAFLEITCHPTSMDWTFEPGYARHEGLWTLGAQVETGDHDTRWWAERTFGDNWRLRTQFQPQDDHYEVSLRYRLHEFLSVEYVVEKQTQFLRLVGNL